MLRGKSRTSRDSHTAADNCVRPKVASRWISDVHRSTLSPAVARFLAQQLGEHAIGSRALGQAVTMSTMRAGNVVVSAQRFANAYCDRFLAAVEMREAGHQGARVELVHLLLKHADADHLPIGVQPLLLGGGKFRTCFRLGHRRCHFFTPYFFAPTSSPLH